MKMVIEWNTHIFSPDLQRYPFHSRAAYRPDLSQKSVDPLQDYLDHMEQEGIDRAVLVYLEPYGDDHQLIVACLEQEKERFRGACLVLSSGYWCSIKIGSLSGTAATDCRYQISCASW